MTTTRPTIATQATPATCDGCDMPPIDCRCDESYDQAREDDAWDAYLDGAS